MKVYVVERCVHEARHVYGVYATREAAIADNPLPDTPHHVFRPGGWQQDDPDREVWWNGLDSSESVEIESYTVRGESRKEEKDPSP